MYATCGARASILEYLVIALLQAYRSGVSARTRFHARQPPRSLSRGTMCRTVAAILSPRAAAADRHAGMQYRRWPLQVWCRLPRQRRASVITPQCPADHPASHDTWRSTCAD